MGDARMDLDDGMLGRSAPPISGGSDGSPDVVLPRRYFDFAQVAMGNGLWDGITRLRYDVYCLECRYLDASQHPNGREIDEFDPHSIHFASTNERSEMVSTLRLVLDSPLGFPLEHHAGTLSEEFRRLPRDKTAEISRLILAKSYRRRANDGLYGEELGDPEKEAAARAEATYKRSQYPLILFGLFTGTTLRGTRGSMLYFTVLRASAAFEAAPASGPSTGPTGAEPACRCGSPPATLALHGPAEGEGVCRISIGPAATGGTHR